MDDSARNVLRDNPRAPTPTLARMPRAGRGGRAEYGGYRLKAYVVVLHREYWDDGDKVLAVAATEAEAMRLADMLAEARRLEDAGTSGEHYRREYTIEEVPFYNTEAR